MIKRVSALDDNKKNNMRKPENSDFMCYQVRRTRTVWILYLIFWLNFKKQKKYFLASTIPLTPFLHAMHVNHHGLPRQTTNNHPPGTGSCNQTQIRVQNVSQRRWQRRCQFQKTCSRSCRRRHAHSVLSGRTRFTGWSENRRFLMKRSFLGPFYWFQIILG